MASLQVTQTFACKYNTRRVRLNEVQRPILRRRTPKLRIVVSKETCHSHVVIIGSGPAGSTYARKLALHGLDVTIIEAGGQQSRRPGRHLKNSIVVQRDINNFTNTVRGQLHQLSVPVNTSTVPTLDPLGYNPDPRGYVRSNQNPLQDPFYNLPAASAAYAVGGKGIHWTCSCPRPNKEVEACSPFFPSDQDYVEAESLLNVHQDVYNGSVRQQVLIEILKETYGAKYGPSIPCKSSPQPWRLAAQRNQLNPEMVDFTGPDTILGEEIVDMLMSGKNTVSDSTGNVKLLDNCICTGLTLNSAGNQILSARAFDSMVGKHINLTADTFVLACGTVLNPQLLWTSLEDHRKESAQERLPALGRYLTEQPLAFCQVIWREDIIQRFFKPLAESGDWGYDPNIDPVPISRTDYDPNAWIPVSKERPWHCQVHRDAFGYGELPPNVDSRLVVDLRWFGKVKEHASNMVEFHTCAKEGITDFLGLPQATFHYEYSAEEKITMHEMMLDMCTFASSIGGFLPGSEPAFQPLGSSLHIHGTTRIGSTPADSVVDQNCKVHGFDNLYLAGNGVIPSAIACNPTLTTVAFAVIGSNNIINSL